MTAFLGVIALDGAAPMDARMPAGIAALGGFAPWGATRDDGPQHRFWVSRGRAGEQIARDGSCVLVFDGRLRDRRGLSRRQGLDPEASDAAIALAIYREHGVDGIVSLDADAAVVVHDAAKRETLLWRDALGERGLRYALVAGQLFVASRGSAVCALAGLEVTPDDTALAHFFALRAPPGATAWMQGVSELPAGALWRHAQGRAELRPPPDWAVPEPSRFASDDEAREAWGAAVRDAVARTFADASQPAVMLSGGVDSTLLAAAASARTRALSWTLPSWPACDEAAFARASAASLSLRHHMFDGDALAPLSRLPSWPIEDEAPLANPYRWLNQALFAEARRHGVDVLASGNFGDHLYAERAHWARSLRHERGTLALLRASWRHRDAGVTTLRRSFAMGRRAPGATTPAWLTPYSTALLTRCDPSASGARVQQAYGRASAQDAELSRRFASAEGIELRFPYRDPGLLRFALALPAHYADGPRGAKWLSREVLRDRVPDAVRLRPKSGSLAPFFRDGVLLHARDDVTALLLAEDAWWPRFVHREPVLTALSRGGGESSLLVLWLAISLELWWRVHRGGGPGVLASTAFLPQRPDLT